MSEALVIVDNVRTGYQAETVLKNVHLEVYPEDFIGILGPNGGGKTTLMKVILGLLPVFSGKVHFPSGRPATGYLPQVTQIDKSFPITVKELVSSGLKEHNPWFPHPKASQRKRLLRMLDEAGLTALAGKPISDLSGGQLQKALLCRALINNPKLLILDEPNTHVDKQFEQELYNWLHELNKEMAILLVSHDIGTITPLVKTIACVNGTLHYHPSNQLTEEVMKVYNCPVDVIAHGPIPHRVLKSHDHE
ncbi:MAG: metal ABC transporter ATP-binding protein [Bacteroidales bacterium]|nr:metal ABC transporter ATP-binding protein [Bacteroidales bacterium]